eukprot:1152575-Pelagomonas_calceolata.AAC.2
MKSQVRAAEWPPQHGSGRLAGRSEGQRTSQTTEEGLQALAPGATGGVWMPQHSSGRLVGCGAGQCPSTKTAEERLHALKPLQLELAGGELLQALAPLHLVGAWAPPRMCNLAGAPTVKGDRRGRTAGHHDGVCTLGSMQLVLRLCVGHSMLHLKHMGRGGGSSWAGCSQGTLSMKSTQYASKSPPVYNVPSVGSQTVPFTFKGYKGYKGKKASVK